MKEKNRKPLPKKEATIKAYNEFMETLGEVSLLALAKKHGINKNTIYDAYHRDNWESQKTERNRQALEAVERRQKDKIEEESEKLLYNRRALLAKLNNRFKELVENYEDFTRDDYFKLSFAFDIFEKNVKAQNIVYGIEDGKKEERNPFDVKDININVVDAKDKEKANEANNQED